MTDTEGTDHASAHVEDPLLIDTFMPRPDFTRVEHRMIGTPASVAFNAARHLDFLDVRSPLLDTAFFVRDLPGRVAAVTGREQTPRLSRLLCTDERVPLVQTAHCCSRQWPSDRLNSAVGIRSARSRRRHETCPHRPSSTAADSRRQSRIRAPRDTSDTTSSHRSLHRTLVLVSPASGRRARRC